MDELHISEAVKLGEDKHHASCRPEFDMELMWACRQCGIVKSAENISENLSHAEGLLREAKEWISNAGSRCCLANDFAYLGKGYCVDCKKAQDLLKRLTPADQKEGK